MYRRNFLKASGGLFAGVIAPPSNRPPNVVMIYTDDLGYGDLHGYGSNIPTPNLDRMASEGARFTQFYAGNALCSPSRAALMTGRYPTRVGVPKVLQPKDTGGLPADETTMAEMLKPRGYRTMCIGKWHLGHTPAYLPTRRGFDEYFGIPYSNDMTPRLLLHNTDVIENPATLETLTPRYTEQALKFIANSKNSPFFLYFAHTYPHIPLAASERFRGKSGQGLYGDVVAEIDWSVGEVLQALRTQGLDQNTLVMFSSDNGPWFQGSPGRLRGRKAWTYEGGHRVPFIAEMPGRIPKSLLCEGIATTMDILPTVARLCNASLPPKPLDGIDIWPLLTGQKKELQREAFLYFDGNELQCARLGRYKLHLARYNSFPWGPQPAGGRVNLPLPELELYDIVDGPDESYDVAAEHPTVVKDILARVEGLIQGFPEEVRAAYAATKARTGKTTSTGSLPYVPK